LWIEIVHQSVNRLMQTWQTFIVYKNGVIRHKQEEISRKD
jgi:hypothetical protein